MLETLLFATPLSNFERSVALVKLVVVGVTRLFGLEMRVEQNVDMSTLQLILRSEVTDLFYMPLRPTKRRTSRLLLLLGDNSERGRLDDGLLLGGGHSRRRVRSFKDSGLLDNVDQWME